VQQAAQACLARLNTDAGGEFTALPPPVIQTAGKGPRTVAKASPPAFDSREQTNNSGFAASVRLFEEMERFQPGAATPSSRPVEYGAVEAEQLDRMWLKPDL